MRKTQGASMSDFSNSIVSLKARSKKARLAFALIGVLIISMVLTSVIYITYRFTNESSPFEQFLKTQEINSESKTYSDNFMWSYSSQPTAEALFENRIEQVLSNALGRNRNTLEAWLHRTPAPDGSAAITKSYDPAKLQIELEPLISGYERFKKADSKPVEKNQDNTYQNIISSLALSIGAVAFVILIIQIGLTFMRYFARLAELYDAQADALDASGGDPELAYKFIEKFSPLAVDFGKIPNTLYEKSIDGLVDIAKSRA